MVYNHKFTYQMWLHELIISLSLSQTDNCAKKMTGKMLNNHVFSFKGSIVIAIMIRH